MKKTIFALGTAFILAGAPPAHAQVASGIAAKETRIEKAERFEKKAEQLQDQRHRWAYAASLYRKAGQLRDQGEQESVDDFTMAARLYYYVRNHTFAVRSMEDAADGALAGGDVNRAAHLFVDAAWLAQRAGNEGTAREFVARADALTGSPLLTAAHRATIRDRIDEGVVVSLIGGSLQ